MSNEIITFEETEKVAKALQGSRYFNDVNNIEQAITKILAGREMGFGPFASMRGVYIIQGAPALSANLMASAVKRSGRYNYRVRETTDQVCRVEFFEGGQSIGVSEFTIENARKAGTKNLDKFPRNMLFARAMSNGVRWYCPDVMGGAAIYTPEELGASVNKDGDIIDAGEWHAEEQPAAVEIKAQAPAPVVKVEQPKAKAPKVERPYTPEALKSAIVTKAGKHMGETMSDGGRGLLVSQIDELFDGDTNQRHRFTKFITGYSSTKNMPVNLLKALQDWITYDQEMARREANAAMVMLDGAASSPLPFDQPTQDEAQIMHELGYEA